MLVRNYDYAPSRFEGVVQSTAWGRHRVIGMSDCLWGLLDGMNDAGLAVSLTFGGRRVLGDGFGIPVVVRYLLETCATVAEARAALGHVPVNLAHNLTLVDGSGEAATALRVTRPGAGVARPGRSRPTTRARSSGRSTRASPARSSASGTWPS